MAPAGTRRPASRGVFAIEEEELLLPDPIALDTSFVVEGVDRHAAPPGLEQWFGMILHKMFEERFSDDLENPTKMMEAFERHNAEVRASVPLDRLLEWTVSDGWEPICERLGVAVPDEAFPATNSTNETRAVLGMPAM